MYLLFFLWIYDMSTLSRASVHIRVAALSIRHSWDSVYENDDINHLPRNVLATEAIVHEMAHAALIRRDCWLSSYTIGSTLYGWRDRRANFHEAAVLAAEAQVLAYFGIKVPMRQLVLDAKWRIGEGYTVTPDTHLARWKAARNHPRVLRAVKRMISYIEMTRLV